MKTIYNQHFRRLQTAILGNVELQKEISIEDGAGYAYQCWPLSDGVFRKRSFAAQAEPES